eukprot:gene2013-2198_t
MKIFTKWGLSDCSSGFIIGIGGAFAMIKATNIALSWILRDVFDFDSSFSTTAASIGGWSGGIVAMA